MSNAHGRKHAHGITGSSGSPHTLGSPERVMQIRYTAAVGTTDEGSVTRYLQEVKSWVAVRVGIASRFTESFVRSVQQVED